MKKSLIIITAFLTFNINSYADDALTDKWINEFQPSALSKEEQKDEINWFIKAAEPYKGMEIRVVSETIATHEYESKTLAAAFTLII